MQDRGNPSRRRGSKNTRRVFQVRRDGDKITDVCELTRHTKRFCVDFRFEKDLIGRTDQFGVELRERVKWDIREGIIGADKFAPNHAAIITWKNVTFAGGIPSAMYKVSQNIIKLPWVEFLE